MSLLKAYRYMLCESLYCLKLYGRTISLHSLALFCWLCQNEEKIVRGHEAASDCSVQVFYEVPAGVLSNALQCLGFNV